MSNPTTDHPAGQQPPKKKRYQLSPSELETDPSPSGTGSERKLIKMNGSQTPLTHLKYTIHGLVIMRWKDRQNGRKICD